MSSQRKSNGSEPHHRILLLEGDEHDAARVEQVLRSNGHGAEVLRVGSESSFADALETFDPDVVVSSGIMGLNSHDALVMSRQRRPEVPFVVIADNVDRGVLESLRAGAADFISKQELERLPAAVETVLSERAPLRRLSRRQREVFRLLASGVTMRDIASQLGLSRKTVETHRAQVMARLGARHVPELVRMAIRLGIVSTEDPVPAAAH
jgi:DNA-binding NarL/FixJ family response regulator